MAPLPRSWIHPSHPEVQTVHINPKDFASSSTSRVNLAPFEVFAKLDFPPCTTADKATYATVQMGVNAHMNLNSDLVYINHSCEPSLIFDMGAKAIIAGPKGLKIGDELTFFYPSTEWDMDQAFDCLCGTPTCFGKISGAKHMITADSLRPVLAGSHLPVWYNDHIIEHLYAHHGFAAGRYPGKIPSHEVALQTNNLVSIFSGTNGNGNGSTEAGEGTASGHGIGSRALSGEMGGDTNGLAK